MKHIICYSGGHSSALVAIEVVRKFGKENVILVNHECKLEPDDVARFEQEVAAYLGMEITYVNMEGSDTMDQFDVVIKRGALTNQKRQALCTTAMKTEPFMAWMRENFVPDSNDCIVYYGFDAKETQRITRRSSIMGAEGYKTDYPLALWEERTIESTTDIGIEPPNSYNVFKHANCVGCLKAGWQHWYIIYCLYPDIWQKAVETENELGYAMHFDSKEKEPVFLEDKIEMFDRMKCLGVEPTEKIIPQSWWAQVRKILKNDDLGTDEDTKPCECIF